MINKTAQAVQDLLRSKGVEARVIEFDASTRTAVDAAKAIGCEVAQIVKSIIFKAVTSGRPVLVLASGINRVSEAAVGSLLGEPIAKADADFVREVTGFAIGGVPPVGHKMALTTFIDESLLRYEEVWGAAGTPHSVVALPAEQLQALTGGRVASVT